MLKNYLFLILATGCASHKPTEWHMYDAGPFRFELPAEMQETQTHGTDSYVAEFGSPSIFLSFDYGPFSVPSSLEEFSHRENFSCHKERIAGEEADIVSFNVAADSGHRFGF